MPSKECRLPGKSLPNVLIRHARDLAGGIRLRPNARVHREHRPQASLADEVDLANLGADVEHRGQRTTLRNESPAGALAADTRVGNPLTRSVPRSCSPRKLAEIPVAATPNGLFTG